jgi:hypothetical protein
MNPLVIQLVIAVEVNKLIIKLITYLIEILNRLVERFKPEAPLIESSGPPVFEISEPPISILSTTYHDNGRFLVYILNNNYLQAHKEVLSSIYLTLMTNEKFLSFGKKKIIIITALTNDGTEYSFHHNVLLTNNTSFEDYYDSVKDIINTNYKDGYQIDVVPRFTVRV